MLKIRGTYPDNWPEIASEIKKQAGWRCEHCDHPHDPQAGRMLTVHHLDGNKTNCAYENLVALCQACHLHIQHHYMVGQQSFVKYPWAVKRGLM